ncbi:ATPase AAA-type core domain-containing protein [Candidatus Electrothrix aarhusensis]|jgi:AAA15 family ATPase/GTPase
MIEQLEIKNFRGFSEYKIEDVGQVNLLVGTNNSGKTSILEAIQLVKAQGNLYDIFSVLSRRGELKYENEIDRHGTAELRRLFHGFQVMQDFAFTVLCLDTKQQNEALSGSIECVAHQSKLIERIPDFYSRFHGYDGNSLFNVSWTDGEECIDREVPVTDDNSLLYEYIKRTNSKPNSLETKNLKFVPSSSLSPESTVSLFEEIVLSPDEESVIEALQIIEPDITRLATIGGSNLSSGDYTRGGIIVKSNKWEERIPIGSFGDGIWRLLGLTLSLVAAKNGTLLIDEIDTGLHHTVMSKMWKLICVTAKKLNVQVFATTHSSDCWKTLADNAVEDEFADMSIRIHRINKDKKRPETFTNKEMHLAADREIEVR